MALQNSIYRAPAFTISAIAAILILTVCPLLADAKDKQHEKEGLVVGTMIMPPFAIKTQSGEWKGLSIEFLKTITQELEIDFQLQEFESIAQVKDALKSSEIDLIPVAVLAEQFEFFIDYTYPYYRSGLAIAIKTEGKGHGWLKIINYFYSTNFLKLICLLILLWMIAGMLVWLFESRRGGEMFGDKITKGIGHGIWWAAVTMTTVGYGDKAPKTIGGRTIAIFWMFVSIILISIFTATITTSLTVGELQSKVSGFHDLAKVRTGSLSNSAAFEYLNEKGINAIPFDGIQSGLQAVADDKITAFVFEEPILRHFVKTEAFNKLHVLAETFNHHYVGMAVPEGSPLLEKLNRKILKVMKKEEWKRLLNIYLGS